MQQILDQEISLSKNLQIEFTSIEEKNSDFKDVIPKIVEEKHPILHKYVYLK
jgi:hypothetical protein